MTNVRIKDNTMKCPNCGSDEIRATGSYSGSGFPTKSYDCDACLIKFEVRITGKRG